MQSGSDAQEESTQPAPGATLRMRDLVRVSGFPRATIHFYQQQGLLPEPLRKVRNSATYGPEHLDRLSRIRELRDQQFLPLRAIKAIFEGVPEQEFTPQQERLLHSMREALPRDTTEERAATELLEVVAATVPENEVEALRAAGLIAPAETSSEVSADDAEILLAWAELKRIGIGPQRGFEATDIGIFDRAMARLVAQEFSLFIPRFADLSGADAVDVVKRAIPILERLLAATHRKKVREFIDEAS
jgi:DNA-binding transcriptional MerR regulator